MSTVTSKPQGFYLAPWGVWGWAETAVKGIGIIIGILAFLATSSISTLMISGNPELGAVIVVSLFTLISLAIIGARFMQRELVSIVYAIANFIGHAAMLIALLRGVDPIYPILFAIAFVVGEFVKQQFLRVSGFTESGQTTSSMVRFSLILAFIYALIVVFILI